VQTWCPFWPIALGRHITPAVNAKNRPKSKSGSLLRSINNRQAPRILALLHYCQRKSADKGDPGSNTVCSKNDVDREIQSLASNTLRLAGSIDVQSLLLPAVRNDVFIAPQADTSHLLAEEGETTQQDTKGQ
jgi:hypothetical protein